jgi:hypothetical protein
LREEKEKMNPFTGELRRLKENEPIPEAFEQLPPELEPAAALVINQAARQNQPAKVSLTSGGKLSRWAAKQRKHKQKMAKESKRKNRA